MKYKIIFILKSLVLAWMVGALSGCATYAPAVGEIESAYYGESPKLYKETIEATVRDILIDPESARFTNYSMPKKDWLSPATGLGAKKYFGWLVCVDVNAKNRYGGYTGRKTYYFLFQDEKVEFFEDREGIWRYDFECER